MLDPQDRHLLLRSLRPPEGYALDCAIGTTYSLDLHAVLTVPLAFTWFDWEDQEGRPVAEPLALLEALRRYAGRLSIFCQAGQIVVPRQHEQLFGYLEGSIVEVSPPSRRGVFHPKVWVLRFEALGEPVIYRVFVLSRNLTFDRSWDTILALNGELANRRNAFAESRPLGDFVAALPDLAVRGSVSERVLRDVERVAAEVRRVRFELPEGFDRLAFWPLGLAGARRWPFRGRIDRMLVVAPFLSARTLARLTRDGGGHVLVSRLETLQTLDDPSLLSRFEKVFFMNPSAEPSEEEQENPGDDPGEAEPIFLSGLHAKVYVADGGRYSSVWVGSANATDQAFDGNIELMVELEGTKGHCGVDVLLSQKGGTATLASLLQPFDPIGTDAEPDPRRKQLEQRLEAARRLLALAPLRMEVERIDGDETFSLALQTLPGTAFAPPEGVGVRCWPVTLREGVAARVLLGGEGVLVTFGQVSPEAITSFLAIEATLTEGSEALVQRFVLNLPLKGAPTDRHERVLRSFVRDRDRVLRFLLLLLAERELEARDLAGLGEGYDGARARPFGTMWGPTLFEALVRTLERNPARLDDVARLVEDLRKSPESAALLPHGFEAIWEPIWATRQRMRHGQPDTAA